MGVEAVIATQVIDTTAVGRSLMTAADAAAARTALSLGTLATQSGTFSGTSSGTNTGDQDLSGYLTSVAAAAAYQVILVSGTNIKTVNGSTLLGSGDLTISGLSGTGSVDNAALRADGTGGATLQSSAWVIADNATASPNNTVNHASLQATGGTTNVSVSIVPKGTGSFSLHVPDGTSAGGDVRGANAVDLQTGRSAASQVGSGQYSFTAGYGNTNSSRDGSAVFGYGSSATSFRGGSPFSAGYQCTNTSTGYGGVALGYRCAISAGDYAQGNISIGNHASVTCRPAGTALNGVAIGDNVTTTAAGGLALGSNSLAAIYGTEAFASGRFSANGDCQKIANVARNVTTSAVATELFLDGSAIRRTITSGKIISALVRVTGVKSDGSEIINFLRDVTIKNVGGTTSLETSPVTIGTDINVSGATLDLSADNTNKTLKIAVTPPTGTWRWAAVVEVALEMAYGT